MIRGKNNKNPESFYTQIALQMSLDSHFTLKKPRWKPQIMLTGVVCARKTIRGSRSKKSPWPPYQKLGE